MWTVITTWVFTALNGLSGYWLQLLMQHLRKFYERSWRGRLLLLGYYHTHLLTCSFSCILLLLTQIVSFDLILELFPNFFSLCSSNRNEYGRWGAATAAECSWQYRNHSSMAERRKDQQTEDVHHRMGVTSNAQKTKKSVIASPIQVPTRRRKEEIPSGSIWRSQSCYNLFVHEIIRQCTSLSLPAEKHYHYQRKQVLVVDTHKSRKVACSYYLLPLAFTEDMADNQKSICLLYELKVTHESSLLDLLLALRCLNHATAAQAAAAGNAQLTSK